MKHTLHENVLVFQSLEPKSSNSAALDGLVTDLRGYDELLAILDTGVATGAASTTVSLRVSANSDGSSSSALSGAAFTAVTSANDQEIYVGRVDLAKLDTNDTQRYCFARGVGDAANAMVYAVTFILSNAKYHPVTQDNTVAFAI